MRQIVGPDEYNLPGEEYTRPPEVPETLRDASRYPGGVGVRPESVAKVDDAPPETLEEPRSRRRRPLRRRRRRRAGPKNGARF